MTSTDNLPATVRELDAAAFARDLVRRLNSGEGWMTDGLPPLHSGAGRAFTRNVIRRFAEMSAMNMSTIVDMARAGWDDADDVVRGLIAEHANSGQTPPALLAAYNIDLLNKQLNPPRLRGRKKATNIVQDINIALIVLLVGENFSLKPTRRSQAHQSACSITAEAINDIKIGRPLNEKAVEAIWSRYSPSILPGWHFVPTVLN